MNTILDRPRLLTSVDLVNVANAAGYVAVMAHFTRFYRSGRVLISPITIWLVFVDAFASILSYGARIYLHSELNATANNEKCR